MANERIGTRENGAPEIGTHESGTREAGAHENGAHEHAGPNIAGHEPVATADAGQPGTTHGPHGPHDRPRHEGPGLIHALQSLLYGVVVAIFIMSFTAQPFRIPSASMEPTLLVGDFVLVAKGNFGASTSDDEAGLLPAAAIRRGDVIVFRYPKDPSLHLVKRVIGVPGDRLHLHADHVFVNGHALDEPYALYEPGPSDLYRDNFPRLETPNPDVDSNWWVRMQTLVAGGELTIPPGEYFVLGDNRNDSEDSRYWGLVPAAAIVGKPVLIYFSLNSPDRMAAGPASGQASGQAAAENRQQAAGAAPAGTAARRLLEVISSFARWNRTLLVVR